MWSELCDQEAGVAFREPAHLTGQNHLQHVSMQLLHDDKDVLQRLEHLLQHDHTRVGQTLDSTHTHTHMLQEITIQDIQSYKLCQHLQNGRFILHLSLLFGGEARLVNNFDGDWSP